MPTIDDALSLGSSGWQILPLNGKVPLTRHGVKDATADLNQIRAWWAHNAHHNVGARVPGHLIVLDFDPRNGGTVEHLTEVLGHELPETLTVHSGREDGGQHRYYRHPGGSVSARRLPSGVDIKTSAGYCVMPPSIHPATGRPYRWELHPVSALPKTLTKLLKPMRPVIPATQHRASLEQRAQHLVRYVESATEGSRNNRLFWAACRATEDNHPVATFDALLEAAMRAGLDQNEAAQTLLSATRVQGGAR